MWQKILTIDSTLNPNNLRKADVSSKTALLDFLQVHCKVCHYMFSVKKCKLPGCVCNPPRLPVDIFDSLHHLPDPIPMMITTLILRVCTVRLKLPKNIAPQESLQKRKVVECHLLPQHSLQEMLML